MMPGQIRTQAIRKISMNLNNYLLGFFVLSACVIFLLDAEQLTYFISDDAYYYLLTAHNIASGVGSTFDGINSTNGYHPQWMLALLPIFYISDDLFSALKWVLILQLFLNVWSMYFISQWHSKAFNSASSWTSIGLLFLFYPPVILMFNGLESSLLLFWLSALLFTDQKFDLLSATASVKSRITLGVMLAGMATARLDTIFILIALAIIKIIWPGFKGGKFYIFKLLAFYLPTIITFIILILPYFAWNISQFGHFTPISGSIKNTFPSPLEVNRIGVQTLPFLIPFLSFFGYVAYSLITKKTWLFKSAFSQWKSNSKYMLILAISFGCLIHLLWTRLFMFFGIYQWHFVAYIIPIIFALTLFIDKTILNNSSIKRGNFIAATGLLVLIFSYNALLIFEKGEHHASRIKAAIWAQDNISPDEGIALSDAGVFGYFSNRTTLNLDGLINSYQFQEAIEDGLLADFLERSNVKYIADVFTKCEAKEHRIFVFAWRGKSIHDPVGYSFTANLSDAVFLGSPQTYRPLSENKKYCFALWKLDDAKASRL
jgi:hypothetical protein